MGKAVKTRKKKVGKFPKKSELADLAGFLDVLIQIDLANKNTQKEQSAVSNNN